MRQFQRVRTQGGGPAPLVLVGAAGWGCKPQAWRLVYVVHGLSAGHNFRILSERGCLGLRRRILQHISAPAQERYQNFQAQYPH